MLLLFVFLIQGTCEASSLPLSYTPRRRGFSFREDPKEVKACAKINKHLGPQTPLVVTAKRIMLGEEAPSRGHKLLNIHKQGPQGVGLLPPSLLLLFPE